MLAINLTLSAQIMDSLSLTLKALMDLVKEMVLRDTAIVSTAIEPRKIVVSNSAPVY